MIEQQSGRIAGKRTTKVLLAFVSGLSGVFRTHSFYMQPMFHISTHSHSHPIANVARYSLVVALLAITRRGVEVTSPLHYFSFRSKLPRHARIQLPQGKYLTSSTSHLPLPSIPLDPP